MQSTSTNACYNNYVDNLINNTNEIIFVDKNMDIITHQDKSLLGTKLLPEYQKTLQNKSNSTTDLDYDGQKLILSHANIKNADWQIILISDIKSFYPAIGKITTTLLFTLLLAVIIAFLLAFFYSKKLSKPIKRLTYMFKKNTGEPLDDIVSNIFNQVSELNVFVEENRDILQNHFMICSYYNSSASDEDLEMRSSVLLRNFHVEYYTSCVIELNRGDRIG